MASVIVIPQAFDLNKRRFPAEKAAAGYCMQRLAARVQGLSWGDGNERIEKNFCQRHGQSIMLSGGMRKLVLLVFLLGSFLSASCQDTPRAADGYVSETVSATEFSVDGVSILCNSKTSFQAAAKGSAPTTVVPWQKGPYLGQRLTVYGQLNLAAHLAVADKIVLGEEEPTRVRGFGIITRVLSSPTEHSDRVVVRADGYPILVDGKADVTFKAPLKSIADVGPNVWIAYDGMQGKDGVVRASRARFIKNTISGMEGKAAPS